MQIPLAQREVALGAVGYWPPVAMQSGEDPREPGTPRIGGRDSPVGSPADGGLELPLPDDEDLGEIAVRRQYAGGIAFEKEVVYAGRLGRGSLRHGCLDTSLV